LREFITLLGGSTTAWPFAALAQQSGRVRRIGLLIGAADDADMRSLYEAFRQGLQSN
jgi:putative ABC transport system substrate-binding protein